MQLVVWYLSPTPLKYKLPRGKDCVLDPSTVPHTQTTLTSLWDQQRWLASRSVQKQIKFKVQSFKPIFKQGKWKILWGEIKPPDKQSWKLTRWDKSCQLNLTLLQKVLEKGKGYNNSIQNANNSVIDEFITGDWS